MEKATERCEFRVGNLDCEHEAAAIERGLKGFPGLAAVRVLPKSARVLLTYDPAVTSSGAIQEKLRNLGFPPQKGMVVVSQPRLWGNSKVLTSVASGVLLAAGWLIGLAGGPPAMSLALYLAAIMVGGYYFGREAIEKLIFERQVGIELLMSIAAVVATLMGEAVEGAMLAFLYSISEAAEGYTEEKTRSAITALMDLVPKMALVRRDGGEIEVPVEEVLVGDIFVVKPGQAVATDGVVLAGTSSVNQAPVTGESVPVEKTTGDAVFAGSINAEGALEVRATKTFADNTIARIIEMVEEAQERKGVSQRFIERFGARYSPVVLMVGVLLAILPPLVGSGRWTEWIGRATVFIVAAAPCALVISIPITLVAALGTGARRGVLIKGGFFLEEMAKIRVVAVDKTGTLTRGEPEVTDVRVLEAPAPGGPTSLPELLAVAAGVERLSQHPLAQAIVRHARRQGIAPADVDDFRSLTGAGARAVWNGSLVYVGSPDMFAQRLGEDLRGQTNEIRRLQSQGNTVVLVGGRADLWGLIAIRDMIRPNARQAVAALHAAGVQRVVMLTGDNRRTAQAIAGELGIEEAWADLRPEDKLVKVRELSARHGHVAMVGDGVNDAPALAEATVGVAMGAAGTDVALETADVALMADDLERLAYALQLARRTQSVIRQNLALSAIVIGALVAGAVSGAFSLPVAVVGHELSELVVIASGLRMLRA
ncbi:MAG: cation-translocating P-type ATPase [Chloroflexi bacterium]|nr:cation-translocating P-type ATPase [Chloroflexota bacterium]